MRFEMTHLLSSDHKNYDVTVKLVTDLYKYWCEKEQLPHIDMNELYAEEMTPRQRTELLFFMTMWQMSELVGKSIQTRGDVGNA